MRAGLPVLTVLGVRTDSRELSGQAITNIHNESKDLGVDVGLDPGASSSETPITR